LATQRFVEKLQSLAQGISQQQQSLRYKGQLEDALNVDLSVVDGARKRPGGFTLAEVGGADPNRTYRMHRIERDDLEEYAVVYGRDLLKVVDLTSGTEASVIIGDTEAQDYLAENNAEADDLRFVTIADTTFILNTKRPTRLEVGSDGANIDSNRMPVRLVRTSLSPLEFTLSKSTFKGRGFQQQVLQADTGTVTGGTFALHFLETTRAIPFDANSSTVQEELEGNGLLSGSNVIDGLNAFPFGKVICTGGPLPDKPIFINISKDVEVDTLITVPNQPNGGTYKVTQGSDERDPAPEFIRLGLPIRDIGFFRNRLCLASDEFMSFSRSDDLFAFYLGEPIAITDADPIELQLSSTGVNVIDFLVPYRNSILASTQSGQQFQLTSDDTFTPSTAAVTPTTRYSTQKVRPVLNGSNLYMAGASNGFSTLLEYFFSDASASDQAVNVSQHVDALIPPDVVRMVTTNTTDAVYMLPTLDGDITDGSIIVSNQTGTWSDGSTWVGGVSPQPSDTCIIASNHVVTFTGYASNNTFVSRQNAPGLVSRIFAYRWYDAGEQRKQSAWARWDFEGDSIQDAICIDDDLFLMRRQTSLSNQSTFLKIDRLALAQTTKSDGNAGRRVHMDHTIDATGTFSDELNQTTFTLTAAQSDTSYDTIVKSDGTEVTGFTNNSSANPPNIVASGNHAGLVQIGRKVKSSIVLSQVFPRTPQGEPLDDGRLTLRKAVVAHRNSGPYTVTVAQPSLPNFVPSRVANAGSTTVGTDEVTVPLNGRSDDLTITIESNNSYPATFSSVEYHGEYNTITE
tara:strand:+ start:426 stop:2816 length:2391 start_codon:yes stop_codon:yes gene_type:complete